MNEEDAFNAEFDSIVQESEPCPVCSRGPVELGSFGNVEDGDLWLYAVCEVGHLYNVERD